MVVVMLTTVVEMVLLMTCSGHDDSDNVDVDNTDGGNNKV